MPWWTSWTRSVPPRRVTRANRPSASISSARTALPCPRRRSGRALPLGARTLPDVDARVDRVLVDGGELVGGEGQVVQGAEILVELVDAAGPDEDRRHPVVAQRPGQR